MNHSFKERFEKLLHSRLREYEGFTEIEANNEVYYIMSFIGIDKLIRGLDLNYGNLAYVFPDYPRRGRYKPLNRAKKISIALTINNCLKDAEYKVAPRVVIDPKECGIFNDDELGE